MTFKLRALVLAAAFTSIGAGAVLACSTTPDAVQRALEDVDASDGTSARGDDADADANAVDACAPRAFDGSPVWVPPRPFHQPACTSAEVTEFVAACYSSSASSRKCKAFKARSAGCAACILSTDRDPARGPIVYFENDTYQEPNYTGCWANALGDISPTGCGAAAGFYDHCGHLACAGCKPLDTREAVDAFFACFRQPGVADVCTSARDNFNEKCSDYFAQSPDNPVEICAGTVPEIIALFCTAPPDGGDAGDDAGDASD